MTKPRTEAVIVKDRKGEWVVQITLTDKTKVIARSGNSQRIVYDNPQRVPTHLKSTIVPRLMAEARAKNLTGQ